MSRSVNPFEWENKLMNPCPFRILVHKAILLVLGLAPLVRASAQATEKAVKEYYDQLKPVQVSGEVVDDEGKPIEAATVEYIFWNAHYLVGKPSKPAPQTVLTDSGGKFAFIAEKPERIFIRSVSKVGYEQIRSENDDIRVDFAQSVSKQAHIRMRKLGAATFLFAKPHDSRVGDRLLDVAAGASKSAKWSVTNLRSYYEYWSDARDFEVIARFDDEQKDWEVTYRALSPDGGLVLSKQELFTAPEDGYEREIRFRTVGGDIQFRQTRYFLYLKSRKPAVYSKIMVDQLIGLPREYPQSSLDISVASMTNPYGERNFEPLKRTAENFQAQDAHTEYCLQCINEGRRADPKHLADLLAKPAESP